MKESMIEKHLVERVKTLGGEIRKVKWIGRRGAPDRVAMLPDVCGPLWVELKAAGKSCRPHQIREHERMKRMGQRVFVINSLEGVDDLLFSIQNRG
ncbi:MAG: VRR-NUC domain [Glomeribacter sp. 1016415]|nr:VRR-NUC domain [Glomeribacter sp. 1016415]